MCNAKAAAVKWSANERNREQIVICQPDWTNRMMSMQNSTDISKKELEKVSQPTPF